MIAALPLWLIFAKLAGLYDRDHRTLRHLTADELAPLLLWVIVSSALTGLIALGYDGSVVSVVMVRALLAAAVAAVCLRASARAVWRRITPPERVAVVGSGPLVDALQRKFGFFRDIHADVVARLTHGEAQSMIAGLDPHIGRIDRLVVVLDAPGDPLLPRLLPYCRANRVKLSILPSRDDRVASIVRVTHLGELSTLEYNTWDVSRSTLLLKRALDLVVSAVGLVVLAPLWSAVALAVYLQDRGPVLFLQSRAGFHGRPFTMWKFRTMVVGAEQLLPELVPLHELEPPVFKIRRDPRVTRVGKVLRRLSLDELPQLVNVLRGEMSLVGPRPEQVEIVAQYRPEDRFRLDAKPGMTGPMQVYGRSELDFEERLAVDRDYVENVSLGRDLRILALTLAVVILRVGAF